MMSRNGLCMEDNDAPAKKYNDAPAQICAVKPGTQTAKPTLKSFALAQKIFNPRLAASWPNKDCLKVGFERFKTCSSLGFNRALRIMCQEGNGKWTDSPRHLDHKGDKLSAFLLATQETQDILEQDKQP